MLKNYRGGVEIDLLLTDPPYNVSYNEKNKFLNKFDKGNRVQKAIENDEMSEDEFYNFLYSCFSSAYNVLKEGGCFYIFYPDKESVNFYSASNDSGLKVHQNLIWVKNNHVLGMQDYQQKHECILYGWKNGNKHYWNNNHSQVTTLNFNKPLKNDLHPTMKPVDILAYLISNNTDIKENLYVLDLFGGSGSTLIACEQTNRICYMMELDPKYVDVIIERYEKFTGNKAIKVN